jgi:hypothetical protein
MEEKERGGVMSLYPYDKDGYCVHCGKGIMRATTLCLAVFIAACVSPVPPTPLPEPTGPTSPTTVGVMTKVPALGSLFAVVGVTSVGYAWLDVSQQHYDPLHTQVVLTVLLDGAFVVDCAFAWEYGDGRTSALRHGLFFTSHLYDVRGSWTARALVTCDDGRTAAASIVVVLPQMCAVGLAPECL